MSSLIFVVILAVWAVYLVQHWVRRRDHLATARSVDRFSESMRVLERRRSLPRPDLAEHAPPTTSVLLRPARPEVVVKRGATAAPAARKILPVVATAVGPTPIHQHARLHAQLRAAGLLVGSVIMVVLVVLTLAQVLHWSWSFVGLALLAGTVGAIRWSVERDRTVRRPPARSSVPPGTAAGRRRPARTAERSTGAASTGVATTDAAGRSPLAAQARAVGVSSTPARRAVDLDRRPEPVLYDVDSDSLTDTELTPVGTPAVGEHAAAPAAGIELDDLPGDAWSPVPVPPPTYTLKARVPRGAEVAPTGSAELPLDGTEMALDEEFEELPSVDRVG